MCNYCKLADCGIDEEIRPFVRFLNESDYTTIASCAGHGKTSPSIVLEERLTPRREALLVQILQKAGIYGFSIIHQHRYWGGDGRDPIGKTSPAIPQQENSEIEFWGHECPKPL